MLPEHAVTLTPPIAQVVLATAHFLRCGWGGCGNQLRGVPNSDRTDHDFRMMATEQGITAYLSNVIDPILDTIGHHRALFGFLVLNEGYGLVRQEDNWLTYLADRTMSLTQLQRFVNRVAGHIARRRPGVLLSASLKIKTCAQQQAEGGQCGTKIPPFSWYEDAALIAAGGDPDGVLSMHQVHSYHHRRSMTQRDTIIAQHDTSRNPLLTILDSSLLKCMHPQVQFYPKNAFGAESSPFRYGRKAFAELHGVAHKPILVWARRMHGTRAYACASHRACASCMRIASCVHAPCIA